MFADQGISIGDVFSGASSPFLRHKYLLVHVDPWYAYCIRYYWFDNLISKWYAWRRRDANNKD